MRGVIRGCSEARILLGFLSLILCRILGVFRVLNLGHFQVGSYRYRSLIEGLYTL